MRGSGFRVHGPGHVGDKTVSRDKTHISYGERFTLWHEQVIRRSAGRQTPPR